MKIIKFIRIHRFYFALAAFCLMGFCLRTFNLNWDGQSFLHPDERAIVMFAENLNMPLSWSEFFSPQSPLNPHFFAYGTFPLYLLKLVASIFSNFDKTAANYENLFVIGRIISALCDSGTIILIGLTASKIFTKRIALWTVFFYSTAVFPIQVSHFYAVDTMLTFFVMGIFWSTIRRLNSKRILWIVLIGLFGGLAIATKISAIPFIVVATFVIVLQFFFKRNFKKRTIAKHLLMLLMLLGIVGAIFVVTEPYVLIDYHEFVRQTLQQSEMTKNAFAFPYTLQYVGIIPYLYELKNIVLWGEGPILGVLSLLGLITFTLLFLGRKTKTNFYFGLTLLLFFVIYFGLVGKFAVGWMRYMLPMYPILAMMAGWFVMLIWEKIGKRKYLKNYLVVTIFVLGVLVWPISFMSIYTKPNTRVVASRWINANIPVGSTIAVEHWDDALPITGSEKYNQLILKLYEPDMPQKWKEVNEILGKTKYIIVSSNRLYVPLQKLTDCSKVPVLFCHKQTANYYQALFDGSLGFKKIAEFENNPSLPMLNVEIDDQKADESFTVYDHPKVMIFEKN